MFTLYFSPGACSMAAHIVLIEAGGAYALERTDTKSGRTESGADYAAVNPRGYVPALQLEDGTVITENLAILQFLADQHPTKKLAPPPGGMARVRSQESLSFLSSELHKAFSPFFSGRELSPVEKDAAAKKLNRAIGHFEAMLADGWANLGGEDFSIADAYAFVILNWTNFIGVSLEPWPRTRAFVQRIGARPAVQRALREEGLLQ
jgi:glutathione S-transferase